MFFLSVVLIIHLDCLLLKNMHFTFTSCHVLTVLSPGILFLGGWGGQRRMNENLVVVDSI